MAQHEEDPRRELATVLKHLKTAVLGLQGAGVEFWLRPKNPEDRNAVDLSFVGHGERETRELGDGRVIPPLHTSPMAGAAASPHLPLSPSPHPFVSVSSLEPATPPPVLPLEKGDITVSLPSENTSAADALAAVRRELGDCTRCRLHGGRTNLVFGDGSPTTSLVFVGEGPGFDEDRQGLPFVGRAGRLLNKMIQALGFQRPDVYICNVVKCRPPDNRTPNADEIETCSPFLFKQIEALRPRALCALGGCAAQTLLATGSPISRLRGKVHSWRGIPLVCTFHPAYLLRTPAQKAAVWTDLLLILSLLQAPKGPAIRERIFP